MRLRAPGRPHLTYCTNIHPGESLGDVERAVVEHVARVKDRLHREGPFGVGLRLSAGAAVELSAPGRLDAFRALLDANGLYVFTINGFPYGAFSGTRVKEGVYRPDWLEPARLAYSDSLAWILAGLLPEGVPGSVSTVPLAFRPRVQQGDAARGHAELLVRHAATLHRIRETTGKRVELALEPEPACFLETTDDTVRFFEQSVFSATSVEALSGETGLSGAEAEDVLRRHLGVCVDACHLAVEFEDARDAVTRLSGAGIRIGKVQVTTALSAALTGDLRSDAAILEALARFDDGVYLHQVVRRGPAGLVRHLDLPDALAAAREAPPRAPEEWRVHFHVPVFEESIAPFATTRPFLRDLLAAVRQGTVSEHLEVETYTWDVLPPEHRSVPVDEAIARELEWTISALERPGASEA